MKNITTQGSFNRNRTCVPAILVQCSEVAFVHCTGITGVQVRFLPGDFWVTIFFIAGWVASFLLRRGFENSSEPLVFRMQTMENLKEFRGILETFAEKIRVAYIHLTVFQQPPK